MKKSTRRSSRRKWVVGGIAFFGSIALLTTGFATWVVGVQQDKQEGDVGVTVETTTNSSIRFEAVLDDKAIKLKETEAKKDGKILSEEKPDPEALDITFSTFKITLGKEATRPTKITMSIAESGETNKQNTATTYLFGKRVGDSGLKYIAAPAEITLTKDSTYTESTDGSGNTVWEITTKKLTFQWGDYFGNSSPCTYYNSFYDDEEEPTEPTQADVDAVAKEMKAMADAFTAQPTIHLTLQLS